MTLEHNQTPMARVSPRHGRFQFKIYKKPPASLPKKTGGLFCEGEVGGGQDSWVFRLAKISIHRVRCLRSMSSRLSLSRWI